MAASLSISRTRSCQRKAAIMGMHPTVGNSRRALERRCALGDPNPACAPAVAAAAVPSISPEDHCRYWSIRLQSCGPTRALWCCGALEKSLALCARLVYSPQWERVRPGKPILMVGPSGSLRRNVCSIHCVVWCLWPAKRSPDPPISEPPAFPPPGLSAAPLSNCLSD